MGPTNIALVKLFKAEQKLREAQARLESAARHVRIQERRTNELAEKLKLAQKELKENQAKAAELDLELQSRDAAIERLRTQQQTAKNNKEYQAFLIEINTGKVDRNKIEDDAMKLLETVERAQNEAGIMQQQLEAEQAKLATLHAESGDTIKRLTADVDALRPARDAAFEATPLKAQDAFNRIVDRFEGEALAPLEKPDRRREEYLCGGCNMSLVADVYNKLHSRDDLVYCPSCRRMLYIPDDLPPETAINSGKPVSKKASSKAKSVESANASPAAAETPVVIEKRAKGQWGKLLTAAQGESVKAAVDAQNDPVSLQVNVDGHVAGYYKGKTREHLERVIRYRMQEAGIEAELEVLETGQEDDGSSSAGEDPTAGSSSDAASTGAASGDTVAATASADVSSHQA
jgi:predicted  nucleic acid-binding Zn-ribbon protein